MIAIACDHAGLKLKGVILNYFTENAIEFRDFGTSTEESCDYPHYAKLAANAVAAGEAERGVVICGTGIGVAIAANKVRGVRCALCDSVFLAQRSRSHNDANVLALGELVVDAPLALEILAAWLGTPFEGGRHSRRVAQLEA
ncbi:MAG: ribose 5-phosphate isomerase B [Oscillospiraceae bacterium]|jgi:ribose 5-phosphate isomerase B|nr:ribose 5-phosphate isomerase B [Oscillospiraceae bacterium]